HSIADYFKTRCFLSTLIALKIDLALPAHFYLKAFRERIYDRQADAVETCRKFITLFVKLSACVQLCEHNLKCGLIVAVKINRDPPAVVLNRNAIISMNSNGNPVAVSLEG